MADVEPLPEVKPYESLRLRGAVDALTVHAGARPGGAGGAAARVRPIRKRNREFLEQFSLDTLRWSAR